MADRELVASYDASTRAEFPAAAADAVVALKRELAEERPSLATRVASQKVLERLIEAVPHLVGGSADLTGSNGTKVKAHRVVARGDFSGSYLHYGVREHAMAAAMNGIALHGGFIPYGGTFLAFADYSRPAIRLAALMGIRVVHVMTHDSIGLGEDGPDAPAGRASGGAAGNSKSPRLPPGRRDRDRGSMARCARAGEDAFDPLPLAPEPADAKAGPHR